MVNGGTVYATGGSGVSPGDGIGNGGGFSGSEPSTFSTGNGGTAVIFAKAGGESGQAIADESGRDSWQGIIFEDNDGIVYGAQTLRENLTITEGQMLSIPATMKLTVPSGVTLQNNGAIKGSGTLFGTVSGNRPEATLDDGMVEIVASVTPEAAGTLSGGGRIEKNTQATLTATPKEGYHFVAWKDGETEMRVSQSLCKPLN